MTNDTFDALTSYIDWLVQANQKASNTQDLSVNRACYLFGVLSEVFEVMAAAPDKLIHECGDVLAYATLALVSLGEHPTDIAIIYQAEQRVANVTSVLTSLTNDCAKLFRGDEGNYTEEVIFGLHTLVQWAAGSAGVSVRTLSIYNQDKLTKRLANTGTFKGTGER